MKRKMLLVLMVMLAIAGELSSLHASEKPEIFLDSVHSVVFSPDGKYCKGRYGVDFVEKINKPRRNLCLV